MRRGNVTVMELNDIRREIDAIDDALVPLFVRRLRCADRVAAAKRRTGAAVLDAAREQAVLDRVAAAAGPEFAEPARELYRAVMALSRARQAERMAAEPERKEVERWN